MQTTAATIEYTVRFGAGFDWVRGGKLPGICTGECPTGCRGVSASDGFSMRVMWTECASSSPRPFAPSLGPALPLHLLTHASTPRSARSAPEPSAYL